MKKLLILLLILNYTLPIINAQNLVPNPSFEEYYQCPDSNAGIQYAQSWLPSRGTPDYFNYCATFNWFGIPNNKLGIQIPRTGNSYAGFCTYTSLDNDYREYFGIELLDTLQIGKKYFFSFYICLSDYSNCISNDIGLRFKTVWSYWSDIDDYSHFKIDSMIHDTANWVNINGSFIADSAYTFVEFGNFYNNPDTVIIDSATTFFDLSAGFASYYYIDDICISDDSLLCNSVNYINTIQKPIVKVFPNPASTYLQIENKNHTTLNCSIFDLFGRKIKQININDYLYKINIEDLKNGIYILKITNNKNKSFNKKFVKF